MTIFPRAARVHERAQDQRGGDVEPGVRLVQGTIGSRHLSHFKQPRHLDRQQDDRNRHPDFGKERHLSGTRPSEGVNPRPSTGWIPRVSSAFAVTSVAL